MIHTSRLDQITDPLTWRLARDTSYRHSPDVEATWASDDVICAECRTVWPCAPRRNADAIMWALEHPDQPESWAAPGVDYAVAAQGRHVPAGGSGRG